MRRERNRILLKGHTQSIKSAVITANQNSIISLSGDCKVMIWKIPKFEDREIIHTHEKVTLIWFSNINGLLYAYSECQTAGVPSKISAWNLINYSQVKEILIPEEKIYFYQVSDDHKLFYAIYYEKSINYNIVSYDLLTGNKVACLELGDIEITSFCISSNHKFLFIGQTFKIQTFYLKNLELYHAQIYHIGVVTQILCTKSERYIISADNANIVKLLDVTYMIDDNYADEIDEILTMKNSGSKIEEMRLINDYSLVIVSSEIVLFWDLDKHAVIKKLKRSGFKYVIPSLDEKYVFLRTSDKIEIWTTEDFSYSSYIQYENDVSLFTISPDNKNIAICDNKDIMIVPSPVAVNKIYICGDISKKYEYIKYISEIINSTSESYKEGFDDWTIDPFHINTLHFYAYYSYDEYLTKALKNGAPFFCTAHGYSALTISLELDYSQCVSAILKEIRLRFNENPYIYLSIESTLPALNDRGYERLHNLYNSMFSLTKNKNLPKFCINNPSFPVVVNSEYFLPKKESFEPKVLFNEDGNDIEFRQSYVQVPLFPGTTQSIELLLSIQACNNKRIYETEFIQILLQEK